jgi:hypothetical protein
MSRGTAKAGKGSALANRGAKGRKEKEAREWTRLWRCFA